jgi:hypothetical protein
MNHIHQRGLPAVNKAATAAIVILFQFLGRFLKHFHGRAIAPNYWTGHDSNQN